MSDIQQMEVDFAAKFQSEQGVITRLEAVDAAKLGSGAAENLKLLRRAGTEGVTRVLARRSASRQAEIEHLFREFIRYGAKAALLTGAQRGGDFLNNQLRGRWAERVALSMAIDGLTLMEFGPSGAAMPGEEDHRQVVMTFKEIQLLEGKRPDLLAFETGRWDQLDEVERSSARTWPERRLEPMDDQTVKKARCGIEVKNSTWHYGQRRASGGGPLSITVKAEEVVEIQEWSRRTGLAVIFIQVLFDEIYCMSFRRIEAAITRGYLYAAGDYELDEQTGEKTYHKFRIAPPRHLCGKVVFPAESTAEIRVLGDGNVVPYINFEPATAIDVLPPVILEEIEYTEPPGTVSTPPDSPPTPSP